MEQIKQENEQLQTIPSDASWQEIYKEAKQFTTVGDYKNAFLFYKQAISICPEENEQLYVQFGHLLMLMKETQLAIEVLSKARCMTGKVGEYNKFFELAQLMEGQESLSLYLEGICIVKQEIEKQEQINILDQNEDILRLKRDMCDAYGAIAELFMSDLEDEKDAQIKSFEFIQKGLEIDALTIDCNFQLANYYLRLGDDDKCMQSMKIVVEQIVKSENETNMGCDYGIEFLIKVSQVLIEIKQFEWAVSILKIIVDKDKDDIEGLYLMAFSQFQIGNFDNTYEFLEELSKHDLSVDEEIESAVQELREELKKKQEDNMEDDDKKSDENDDDENEWMDIE